MEAEWVGSAVSIVCDDVLGVFQGIIKDITSTEITIVRAFRNGVPLRKQNAEVVLQSSDILKINLIPAAEQNADTHTPTVINKPTPVKLPNFSNILGAKLQQLQQQQLQQQQQQQCHLEEQQQQQPLTPRSKANGHVNAGRNGGGAGGFGSASKSTLSDKMQQLKLNTNGNLRTPNVNARVPSAQQSQQQPLAVTPNSVAAFFGNLIPPKVEVKIGSALYNGGNNLGNGVMDNHCVSNIEGSSVSVEANCAETTSRPIDIVGNGGYYQQQQQQQASYSNGQNAHNGRRNGNGTGISNSYTNGSNGFNGNSNVNGNGKNKQRNRVRRESSMRQQQQQTFGSEADDALLQEDFDFEGNLALFDKRAIWDDIESTHQKPDVTRHVVRAQSQQEKKYRHDENILASKPLELRQIESMFEGSKDFVTDDGLIIPTIPQFVRTKIELTADKAGLSLQRQIDILARGASDLAITLLGGARRLTQTNNHQWPKIVIICDGPKNIRTINIGAATGRQLASHGLSVMLYVEQEQLLQQNSSNIEISLFRATNNAIVHTVDVLTTPDLVILSTNTANLSEKIKKWLSVNRASLLAIDPPTCGIYDVAIKYSILPILPLNGISTVTTTSSATATPTPIITATTSAAAAAAAATTTTTTTSTNNCGKLYLCNLGIPDKFYRDCGIKYKSPYGHKYVIPIHSKD